MGADDDGLSAGPTGKLVTPPQKEKHMAEASQQPINDQQIWEALKEVPDPELPAISVIDMGIVRRVDVDAAHSHIHIEITPTFSGCPALPQIQQTILARLSSLATNVEVIVSMRDSWTSDMLSEDAHRKLRGVGIAPPPKVGRGRIIPMLTSRPLTCPHCASQQTVLENAFGPTPCRAIAYCTQCHQPFEQFKPI
jgi:ring-1,2-phenylacetyl-CoA epoxidase subunit PaaD